MLDVFWAFLKDPANREVLGWIGAGVVAIAVKVFREVASSAKTEGEQLPRPLWRATAMAARFT
jgi:hypothetical protein